jgi:hypothetical protein
MRRDHPLEYVAQVGPRVDAVGPARGHDAVENRRALAPDIAPTEEPVLSPGDHFSISCQRPPRRAGASWITLSVSFANCGSASAESVSVAIPKSCGLPDEPDDGGVSRAAGEQRDGADQPERDIDVRGVRDGAGGGGVRPGREPDLRKVPERGWRDPRGDERRGADRVKRSRFRSWVSPECRVNGGRDFLRGRLLRPAPGLRAPPACRGTTREARPGRRGSRCGR